MADLNDSVSTPSTPADTDTSPVTSEVNATLSKDGLNVSATDKGELSITERIKATFENKASVNITAEDIGFEYSELVSIQEKIQDTLTRTVTNKNEIAFDSDSLKISETLTDSYNFNDKLTYTDKEGSSFDLDKDGFRFGITDEQSLDYKPTDYYSENITHKEGVQLTNKKASYENSVSTSQRFGTDDNYLKYANKYGITLSSDKGLELADEESVSVKTEGFEANSSVKSSASFDGEKLKAGYETSDSVKVGDKDNNVELYNKSSISADSDGAVTQSNTQGMNVKTEKFEFGNEQTHSVSESEDSFEETHQSKTTVGMEVADGVKVKNTTTHEVSEKVSESEEAVTEESSESISSETRIEVDPEKAGIGAAIGAEIFNSGMAIAETAMKSESTTETVTPKQQEEETEEEVEAESEGEAEAETQAEAEAETQAQAEEEKRMQEELEEDVRVNEELNQKSEELMNEHENAMDIDREEYAKELEDNSYDQPGDGKSAHDMVNFDQGESADYSYGY